MSIKVYATGSSKGLLTVMWNISQKFAVARRLWMNRSD